MTPIERCPEGHEAGPNEPDDLDDPDDDFEEELSNCSGFWDGNVFMCQAVGSEQCDWECPLSRDIGKTQKQIMRQAFHAIPKEGE